MPLRLTERSACAGCASKLGAAQLAAILARVPMPKHGRVLVGATTGDDAGVVKLRDDLAIVQTVDFFTPIVDDPFEYGRIAATNAISDVYAMGGTPISALNICAFPEDLDDDVIVEILRGGADVATRAGVAIVGGHTIKSDEPKYGMAVTGTIHPDRIVTNAGARVGDVLVLTKPLGTGILTTAHKRGAIDDAGLREAIASMTTLNDVAAQAMLAAGAHAATDVTGFGLLGHAGEVAHASAVRLVINASAVPLFDCVLELIDADCIPGGTRTNRATHAGFTTFEPDVPEALRVALSDAQTSGGLLVVLPAGSETDFGTVVGRVEAGAGIRVEYGEGVRR
ncbi:MAG: selenide, water dikinase SelD [Candidatus Eremiobacteraeota bacterium]|nr:selenide, water dikinase SelD [Candidatus Eremiobacteraeota bacterium]